MGGYKYQNHPTLIITNTINTVRQDFDVNWTIVSVQ